MNKLKSNRRMNPANVPILRFSPWAWSKLLFLRDAGPTEIGGFGISSERDLLLVEDIVLVSQQCSQAFVAFDDDSVADFFDKQIDRGLNPARFARIWVHTHPGNSADPSITDEETLENVFGLSDWAVMFILARGGRTYGRLQFNVGPRGEVELDVEVDYGQPFPASDHTSWQAEYLANVHPMIVPDKMLTPGLTDKPDWFELAQRHSVDTSWEDFPYGNERVF